MADKMGLYSFLVPSILSHSQFLKMHAELYPPEMPIFPGIEADVIGDFIDEFDCKKKGENFEPSAAIQYSIFKTYPGVEKIYKKMVPGRIKQCTFWTEFRSSNYVERCCRGVAQSDIFTEAIKIDEEKMAKIIEKMVSVDPEEAEPPVLTAPSISNLFKNMNQHSAMVLQAIEATEPQKFSEQKKAASKFRVFLEADNKKKQISKELQNRVPLGEKQTSKESQYKVSLFKDPWLDDILDTSKHYEKVLNLNAAAEDLTPYLEGKWRQLLEGAEFLLRYFYLHLSPKLNDQDAAELHATYAALQNYKRSKVDIFACHTKWFKDMGLDMTEDIYMMLERADDWYRKRIALYLV